jgi:hypothetical protein
MRTSYIQTNNLALASGLLALGIPFHEETPFIKARSTKGEQYTFFFQDISNCGNFKTSEMMKAWDDRAFATNNPEHPLSYIRCAYQNKEGLLDKVNQDLDLVVIEKNGKLAIISKNASAELQEKVFSQL